MKAKFQISGRYQFDKVEIEVGSAGVYIRNKDKEAEYSSASWIGFDYEQLDSLYQALKWINSVRYKIGEIEKEVEEHVEKVDVR